MITTRQPPRPSPAPAAPRPAGLHSGLELTAQQLAELWAAYMADRSDVRLRNRLVEHYVPCVRNIAGAIANEMRLRDADNAVGEVLALLLTTIVPCYGGKGDFENLGPRLRAAETDRPAPRGAQDRGPLPRHAPGGLDPPPGSRAGGAKPGPRLRLLDGRAEQPAGPGPLAAMVSRPAGESGCRAVEGFPAEGQSLHARCRGGPEKTMGGVPDRRPSFVLGVRVPHVLSLGDFPCPSFLPLPKTLP